MAAVAVLRRLEEEAKASIRTAFAAIREPILAEAESDHCPECRETSTRFAGN
jgi:hypothetical protein